MESTLANVDLGRYRRIVQMFWDPEPSNDPALDQPVWCLGCSYQLSTDKDPVNVAAPTQQSTTESDEPASNIKATPPTEQTDRPETLPESVSSSFSSSLAYEDAAHQGSWPKSFIDDFESRFWMTYRSEFEMIPRSSDPKATSSLSLSMRIKTQFADQTGFTSDSGWGCMIRSGQSLLANAIALLRLGRGKSSSLSDCSSVLTKSQTGEGAAWPRKRGSSFGCSQMTPDPLTQSTSLCSMARVHAENILANGLALQLQLDASSKLANRMLG